MSDGRLSRARNTHPADDRVTLFQEGRNQVGMEIRTLHRYGFRSGDWARITAWSDDAEGPCWLVEFPDGTTDWWRCDDPDGNYEIRSAS